MPDLALPTQDRVEGYFKELHNWGRWGNNDQLGTLNLITQARQLRAQQLIKSGRTVSLARDVIPRPVYMYHATFPSKRERVDVVTDRFDMVYHGFWITHVDALCHVAWDGEIYNGRGFSEHVSAEGATWCSIDPIFTKGITTRGVLLDVAARAARAMSPSAIQSRPRSWTRPSTAPASRWSRVTWWGTQW